MVIYDAAGVKGFSPLSLIVFPFEKNKKLIVDNAKRRRSAKFAIAFSWTFILGIVCTVMWLPAVDLLEWSSQVSGLYFFGFLCVIQWRPKVIFLDSQPDELSAKVSWTYLLEFASTLFPLAFIFLLMLVRSGYLGSSSPLAIVQQFLFLGMIVLFFIPLIDIVRVKRLQSARKG